MVHVLRQHGRRRDRRAADDHQRSRAARRDARGARRGAAGAGRRARAAALADSDSVAVPERGLRARDGGGGRARGRRGFTHVAFGDLFLEDIRRYREERLAGTGLTPLFPLFGADTPALAREMIAGGLRARLTCVEPEGARSLVRRPRVRRGAARRAAADVDPCGERGEFHTFAYAGPMFAQPIPIETGDDRRARRLRLRRSAASAIVRDHPSRPMTSIPAHRLPDRRDDRDALPARPGRSRRRRLRLHGAAAGGAAEAEGLGVHQRAGSTRSRRSSRISCSRSRICRPTSRPSWSGAASPVVTFNQRSVAEILQMIRMLGGLVGCQAEAEALADRLERGPRRASAVGGALSASGRACSSRNGTSR